MKFLAIEKEIIKSGYTEELLKTEALMVYKLYKQGIIREIYFTKEDHTAIIIFEGNSITEVKILMHNYL